MAETPQKPKKVRFEYPVPAGEVLLVGDFTQWESAVIKLKRGRKTAWQVDVSLSPGRYEYRFIVDGTWTDDPACDSRSPNEFGGVNCVRVVT